MRNTAKLDPGPSDWIGRLPATITPTEFGSLVQARISCVAVCSDKGRPAQEQSAAQSGCKDGHQLKFEPQQYLQAFKNIATNPRPSKSWLGSKWQRQNAEQLILQQQAKDSVNSHQPAKCKEDTHEGSAAPARPEAGKDKKTHASETGMQNSFLLHLEARRRDELRKKREKQAREKREREEAAIANAKRMEVKKLKLEACNKQRVLECANAKSSLMENAREMAELTSRLDGIKARLTKVNNEKHAAVMQLKERLAQLNATAPQAVSSSVAAVPSGAIDVHNSARVGLKHPAMPHAATNNARGKDRAHLADGNAETDEMHSAHVATDATTDDSKLPVQLGVLTPMVPHSSGVLIQKLFSSVSEQSTIQTSDDRRLKRKWDAYSPGSSANPVEGKDSAPFAPTSQADSPAISNPGFSGVRGRSGPPAIPNEASQQSAAVPPNPMPPGHDFDRPLPSASQPPDRVPSPAAGPAAKAGWDMRDALPAPPAGALWKPGAGTHAPSLHNLPPPAAISNLNDLPPPPPLHARKGVPGQKPWASPPGPPRN